MKRLVALLCVTAVLAICSCSSPDADPTVVTLLTHDSFRISPGVLADFEHRSGLKVRVLRSGDAGTLVNQAVLSKGHPQGDVLYGVDNTFLSRAVRAGIFTPYRAPTATQVPRAFDLDPAVTPIDYGDVCVNYDKAWYTAHRLAPPRTFEDLTAPAYRNQLVVENPATSSPGLAFLLGTIASFGEAGWTGWWKRLRANGALVTDTWAEAYRQRFTVGSGGQGNRPLVVSYASSPPAEVLYAAERPATAPSGVLVDTCFRQIEFAGLLAGAKNSAGGRKLVDFLLSAEFQRDLPLQEFVLPVLPGTPLPREFTAYATLPARPLTLPAGEIDAHRDAWISRWTASVLR
ncbi:thiamine ABC transporter substrate-binding protein [Cryptosporangium phraense]|uniref:Thiamine ABC transporter substrate-binding protein n=1 Tax=Cryptosporangium phraense TaxID=2593070 RepID=A0A545AQD6_9ACTN|nr:thiamine ABC transporter substrate-binding protein [Cryptosporangium phraense]TQS43461.1 thiamine ABC transporter substrate-binding protein [Cryptosporangium phraense]